MIEVKLTAIFPICSARGWLAEKILSLVRR
jgi:hypothetical protein